MASKADEGSDPEEGFVHNDDRRTDLIQQPSATQDVRETSSLLDHNQRPPTIASNGNVIGLGQEPQMLNDTDGGASTSESPGPAELAFLCGRANRMLYPTVEDARRHDREVATPMAHPSEPQAHRRRNRTQRRQATPIIAENGPVNRSGGCRQTATTSRPSRRRPLSSSERTAEPSPSSNHPTTNTDLGHRRNSNLVIRRRPRGLVGSSRKRIRLDPDVSSESARSTETSGSNVAKPTRKKRKCRGKSKRAENDNQGWEDWDNEILWDKKRLGLTYEAITHSIGRSNQACRLQGCKQNAWWWRICQRGWFRFSEGRVPWRSYSDTYERVEGKPRIDPPKANAKVQKEIDDRQQLRYLEPRPVPPTQPPPTRPDNLFNYERTRDSLAILQTTSDMRYQGVAPTSLPPLQNIHPTTLPWARPGREVATLHNDSHRWSDPHGDLAQAGPSMEYGSRAHLRLPTPPMLRDYRQAYTTQEHTLPSIEPYEETEETDHAGTGEFRIRDPNSETLELSPRTLDSSTPFYQRSLPTLRASFNFHESPRHRYYNNHFSRLDDRPSSPTPYRHPLSSPEPVVDHNTHYSGFATSTSRPEARPLLPSFERQMAALRHDHPSYFPQTQHSESYQSMEPPNERLHMTDHSRALAEQRMGHGQSSQDPAIQEGVNHLDSNGGSGYTQQAPPTIENRRAFGTHETTQGRYYHRSPAMQEEANLQESIRGSRPAQQTIHMTERWRALEEQRVNQEQHSHSAQQEDASRPDSRRGRRPPRRR